MRFLVDVHVHRGAVDELRRRGVDVVHAVELGLGEVSDADLLERSIVEDRIILTRNYGDFELLVAAYARAKRELPGVLFISSVIRPSDAGGLVRALVAWIERWESSANPVRNSRGYLVPD